METLTWSYSSSKESIHLDPVAVLSPDGVDVLLRSPEGEDGKSAWSGINGLLLEGDLEKSFKLVDIDGLGRAKRDSELAHVDCG